MNTNQYTEVKKAWITPAIENLDQHIIKQEINQQDMDLINLLASDEKAFRLLTGSTGR
jgi:hypothetical protein